MRMRVNSSVNKSLISIIVIFCLFLVYTYHLESVITPQKLYCTIDQDMFNTLPRTRKSNLHHYTNSYKEPSSTENASVDELIQSLTIGDMDKARLALLDQYSQSRDLDTITHDWKFQIASGLGGKELPLVGAEGEESSQNDYQIASLDPKALKFENNKLDTSFLQTYFPQADRFKNESGFHFNDNFRFNYDIPPRNDDLTGKPSSFYGNPDDTGHFFNPQSYLHEILSQLYSSSYYLPDPTVLTPPPVGIGGVSFVGYVLRKPIPPSGVIKTINGSVVLNLPQKYSLKNAAITAETAYIGTVHTADFSQENSTINLTDVLNVGLNEDVFGVYTLISGTLQSDREIIGGLGHGNFTQFQGRNDVTSRLSLGAGFQASNGEYTLKGGSLYVKDLLVGERGQGIFTQAGGNSYLQYLFVGYAKNSDGEYYLNDGALSIEYNGTISTLNGSTGRFIQNGGSYDSKKLYIAYAPGSTGEYQLNGGTLTTEETNVGYLGSGTLIQNNGKFKTDTLFIARDGGSSGMYILNHGSSESTDIYLGGYGYSQYFAQGVLQQNGGTLNTENLVIGHSPESKGQYILTGGTLNADNITGGPGISELIIDGGILNVTNSITDISSLYFGFNNDVENWLIQENIQVGNLYLSYQPGIESSIILEDSHLKTTSSTNDRDSAVLEFATGNQFIGYNGTARLTQLGGMNEVFNLTVGYKALSEGTYELTNGTIKSTYEVIGHYGEGSFIQNYSSIKSSNDVYRLYLGYSAGAKGDYVLYNGDLNVSIETIGDEGEGLFTQLSGNHTVSKQLTLGNQVLSRGYYTLEAGQLETYVTFLGNRGTGEITQNGGTNKTKRLLLGLYEGAYGKYELSDGKLDISQDSIIGTKGVGEFTQSGGEINAKKITIADQKNSSGKFTITEGTLNVATLIVGNQGAGRFDILSSSAQIKITETLILGATSGTHAVYGSTVVFDSASFQNKSSSDDSHLGLNNTTFVFEHGTNFIEIGSVNYGSSLEGFEGNFALDSLLLFDAGTILTLLDSFDNQPSVMGKEALYVKDLFLGEGVTLNLNGFDLYCLNFDSENAQINYNGGHLVNIEMLQETAMMGELLPLSLKQGLFPVPEPSLSFLFVWGALFMAATRIRHKSN